MYSEPEMISGMTLMALRDRVLEITLGDSAPTASLREGHSQVV
jgi:hypothetical protein